jgi:hypothetical protein
MMNEARAILQAYRERHPERAGPTPYEFRLKLLLTPYDLQFLSDLKVSLEKGTDVL